MLTSKKLQQMMYDELAMKIAARKLKKLGEQAKLEYALEKPISENDACNRKRILDKLVDQAALEVLARIVVSRCGKYKKDEVNTCIKNARGQAIKNLKRRKIVK